MKKFTKTLLSLLLVFCSIFLVACGGSGKSELDSKVSVNTQSNNYQAQQDKSSFNALSDPTSEDYLNISEISGVKMTMDVKVDGISYMDLTAIAKNKAESLEIAMKTTMTDDQNQRISAEAYIKDNNYYINLNGLKYYYDLDDMQGDEDLENEGLTMVTGFDLDSTLDSITTALENVNASLSVAEEISGNKITKKFKVNYASEYTAGFVNEAVIIVVDGKFAGLFYYFETTPGTVLTLNLIPFANDIKYPSFNDYIKFGLSGPIA